MKILSVFKTPLIRTPRPRRLLEALSREHDVYYICPPELNEEPDNKRFGYLYRQLQSRFTRWVSKTALKIGWFSIACKLESSKFTIPVIRDGEFDIVFIHDLYLLPKFSHLKQTRVVFDAREYYPTEFADNAQWASTIGKLATYTCKQYMPQADEVITVSPSLVELYKKLINMPITFFPSYPKASYLIKPNLKELTLPIRFVHHGNAFENRGLERMIDLMERLGNDYQLDMMLVTAPGNRYFDNLKKRVSACANVNILAPVHPDKITEVCSSYHFGLYLMSVNESQNRFCLPNKYFEFLFSGLPVITSFSRDMKHITDKYQLGLGFLDEEIDSIATSIQNISNRDYLDFKRNIAKYAPQWTVVRNIQHAFPDLLQVTD